MNKLRVWNMINFGRMDYYDVESMKEAVLTIGNLADAQLKNKLITDNAFGLEEYEPDEEGVFDWFEWYDDEGNDVTAYEVIDGKLKLREDIE